MLSTEKLLKHAKRLYHDEKYKEIIALLGDETLQRHNNAVLFFYCGDAYNENGQLDEAIKCYTSSIELDPNPAAYHNRGFSWEKKNDYDKAIADYNKSIELENNDNNAYVNRGVAWHRKGDYKKAIADYNKAIELAPNDELAYFNRGIALYIIGEYEKSIADNSKAIELAPNNPQAYYSRGLALKTSKSDNGSIKKALSDFKKYTEIIEDKTSFHYKQALSNIEELKKILDSKDYGKISELVGKIRELLLYNEPNLTHYTSISVAGVLIFDQGKFRLSEGAFLNDTSEGRELFEFLNFHPKPTHENGTVERLFLRKPFIGSFVADTKNNDLTLWRMYGKENKEEARGCAITLDRQQFLDNIKSEFAGEDESNTRKVSLDENNFYRVAYNLHEESEKFIIPGAQETESELNALMKKLRTAVSKFKKPYDKTPTEVKDVEELLNSIAYLFKTAEYQYEHELRLVVSGVGLPKKLNRAVTPPRAYIELVDISPLIQKITLGPKVDRADEWAAAFHYALDEIDCHPEILISQLPFK